MKTIRILLLLSVSLMVFANENSILHADSKKDVDVSKSKILWTGSKPGGKHNGKVSLSEGYLFLNAKNEVIGGEFVIDLNSIVNYDLENENMNERLVGHLKSEDFFHVDKYPTAKFVITEVKKLKKPVTDEKGFSGTHLIKGDLAIKDITKPVYFKVIIDSKDGKVVAETEEFTIDRTDWGVNYQSKKIFAELKDKFIYDEMLLSVKLQSE